MVFFILNCEGKSFEKYISFLIEQITKYIYSLISSNARVLGSKFNFK